MAIGRCNVVICMQGGAKVQEAKYIYQELGDKYNYTASSIKGFRSFVRALLSLSGCMQASLYNGRAVCYMKEGDYEEAERDLLEAFNKDAKNPDTLANLITCGLHLGKNIQRYIT